MLGRSLVKSIAPLLEKGHDEPVIVPEAVVETVQTSGKIVKSNDISLDWTVDSLSHIPSKESFAIVDSSIKIAFSRISDNFGVIGKGLYALQYYDSFLWSSSERYANVFDYAAKVYDIKKSTVYNLINVYREFCEQSGRVSEYYRQFSFSKLVEMSSMEYQQRKHITPDMTVAQIRAYKKGLPDFPFKTIDKIVSAVNGPKSIADFPDVLPNQISMESMACSDDSDVGIAQTEHEDHSDVGTEQAATPQEPQDTVYLHFANLEELRDWYFSDERKNAPFPLTIAYRKTDKTE